MAPQRRSDMIEFLEPRLLMAVGGSYAVPADPRVTVNINAGWRHTESNPAGAQAIGFNDGGWATVDVPHSYNADDGANGGNNYYRGVAWYRKTVDVPTTLSGKQVYLQFEGVFNAADVYVDGVQLGARHIGGFSSFNFDATAQLTPGSHVLAVKVDNSQALEDVAPPMNGDYTKAGGIYRDVYLLGVNKAHAAKREFLADTNRHINSEGVYFTASNVSAASAGVQVRTVLTNDTAAARPMRVKSVLVDRRGRIVFEQSGTPSLAAGETAAVTQAGTVANPKLWNGRIDPYLHTLYVEVRDPATGKLLDLVKYKVGIRSFTVSPSQGFFLNGRHYDLYGANAHQDAFGVGTGRTDADVRRDLDLQLEMGATAMRTAHYPHNQAMYDYADQTGLIVYTEVSINNTSGGGPVPGGQAFVDNSRDQFREMVRENYNHPSVVVWGLYNEISGSDPDAVNLINNLQALSKIEDPTRVTTAASWNGSVGSFERITDTIGFNKYYGWYEGTLAEPGMASGAGLDDDHANNPNTPIGISEYGGGASAYQHQLNPPFVANPNGQRWHPENRQALIHEDNWRAYAARPWLWYKLIWQMFDAAADQRGEGEQSGLNDKGIVTSDRRTLKDAYFFYQANWNDPARPWANRKVLHLTDRRWTSRNAAANTVKVYSNLGTPTLLLNGASLGAMTPQGQGVYTMNVTLPAGDNQVTVTRAHGGRTYKDTSLLRYRNALAGTQVARVQFQPAAATTFGGYVVDSGGAYGARGGATYGWVGSANNTTFSDPDANRDARYDAGINVGYSQITDAGPTWEYALPDGVYDVHITGGQTGDTNLVHNFRLEGVTMAMDSDGGVAGDSYDEFYARVTVRDGRLTLSAARGAVNARLNYVDVNAVGGDAVRPVVAAVTVNDDAAQRSKLQSVTVVFNKPVTLAADAVSLALRGGGALAVTASNPSGDGRTYELAVAGGLANVADGVYDLVVTAAKVSDGANVMPEDYAVALHKLFGDADGDGDVDGGDATAFDAAFGSVAAADAYRWYFDHDGDGDVDSVDSLRFRTRLGTALPV